MGEECTWLHPELASNEPPVKKAHTEMPEASSVQPSSSSSDSAEFELKGVFKRLFGMADKVKQYENQ